MKILTIALVLLVNTAWAQSWQDHREARVLKVLSDETVNWEHEVRTESFNRNFDGYGCPWPGIIGDDYIMNHRAKLRHGHNSMDLNGLRIVFNNEQEYCHGGWPTAESVFGPEYVVGSKLPLVYHVKLEIVQLKDFSDNWVKFLKETVSTKVLKRNVQSTAYVPLETVFE